MTEKTNKTVAKAIGTLYYDATCGFCTRGINRLRKPLTSRAIEVRPFRDGAGETEMKLRLANGEVLGGAEAARFLALQFPVTFLPALLFGIPPFNFLADVIYKKVAANRHCLNGACPIDLREEKKPGNSWWLTILLVIAAVAVGIIFELTGWIWMWLLAFAMWLGFKIMSYRKGGGATEIDPLFFLWPGMNPAGFAWDKKVPKPKIPITEATLFFATGIVLLAALPRVGNELAKGWFGVAAMLCLLHFGSFVWLCAFWNRYGYSVEPIMNRPWFAKGLGDFWGNRWNRAFSDWAREFLFLPLTRKLGTTRGTMAGFLASGIAHEFAISVPARGGFGLPTLYFLIQAIGLLIEKRFRLRRKGLARTWLWIVVLVPAPLLFHTAFIENVFNPMTKLITALWTH